MILLMVSNRGVLYSHNWALCGNRARFTGYSYKHDDVISRGLLGSNIILYGGFSLTQALVFGTDIRGRFDQLRLIENLSEIQEAMPGIACGNMRGVKIV